MIATKDALDVNKLFDPVTLFMQFGSKVVCHLYDDCPEGNDLLPIVSNPYSIKFTGCTMCSVCMEKSNNGK